MDRWVGGMEFFTDSSSGSLLSSSLKTAVAGAIHARACSKMSVEFASIRRFLAASAFMNSSNGRDRNTDGEARVLCRRSGELICHLSQQALWPELQICYGQLSSFSWPISLAHQINPAIPGSWR